MRNTVLARSRTLGTVAVLAGLLLLTGCAGTAAQTPAASPTPSATPAPATSTPTPTPTPTPTALSLDDPTTWVIGFTGIGPLSVGDNIDDAAASMTAFTSTVYDGCPAVVAYGRTGFPTVLIPDRLGTGVVEQLVLQGGADFTTLAGASPHTDAGIGIGSTLDDLMTAYPAVTFQDDPFTAHYALPDDTGNWINFVLSDDVVKDIIVRASPVVAKEYCG
ncbi:hypothetical protein [Cryobacterium sp. PAMC25264]|uniref:hypothetical protein n=1 Tax=Cryobacterium sp. PAMC25264 TaxID=2861288 RepID=UPI001C635042|nr:hypothetical protein [Cryobacterium sp. PAMC25264]QYF74158.1 hypothetical protein KY500_02660 [Cryobacterium sp. PAMC25264]